MKPEKRARAKNVTAQPRALRNGAPHERPEEGLSIDPEQMGESFLRYATQTDSTETDALPELRPDGAPETDAAQLGVHFSSEASIWENTADLVRERGDVDEVTNEAVPPYPEVTQDMEPGPAHVVEIDLTESVIEEASLLDEESSVLGETVPKHPRTEDTGPRRRAEEEPED